MTLRCHLFPTLPRASTLYFAVRDTLTPSDPNIDAFVVDEIHARQGRFGIGHHFLILTNGDIQLCRHLQTIGSHSRNLDEVSIAIGLVGGVGPSGDRMNTRTPEQLEALDDILGVLREYYPEAEVHDRPQ